MNLRHVEIFRAVMHTGSTKSAAELLLISQPAVSKLLGQFERQLGFALFERSGGRLLPTREAEALYESAGHIFSSFDAFQSLVHDIKDKQAGSLKILTSPSFGHTVLPEAIASFSKDHPSVKIRFDIATHEHIVRDLDSRQADFALTIAPIIHPSLHYEHLRDGRLVCVFPKGHWLEEKEVVELADLENLKLISYPRLSPIGLIVDEAFLAADQIQTISIEVQFCFTACTLVNSGTGVAVVDEFTVSTGSFNNIGVRPLNTQQCVSASLIHSGNRPLSRLSTLFIEDYLSSGLGIPSQPSS